MPPARPCCPGCARRPFARLVATAVAAAAVAGAAGASAQPEEVLIDRTLAIVAGQIITLADVRTLAALGLVEHGEANLAAAVERLIERALIVREVERYAPGEPPEAEVEARLVELQARVASPDDLARVLAAGGFTRARLREWVRDDLRIAAYLDQRFAAVGVPGDQEVSAYYAARREEFDRSGLLPDEILALVRTRLAAERRAQMIADWVADLRRRADVVVLYRQEAGEAGASCRNMPGCGRFARRQPGSITA